MARWKERRPRMRQISPDPDHIPLRYLKGLVPKLLFYDAELNTYLESRESFIALLDALAETAVSRSQRDVRLDHSLSKIVEVLRGVFGDAEALTIFKDATQRVNCGLCAGEAGRAPCCGNIDEDPVTLSNPGHCITAIHVL